MEDMYNFRIWGVSVIQMGSEYKTILPIFILKTNYLNSFYDYDKITVMV